MSRQADTIVKTGDSKSAVVKHDLADFTCPVTQSLFFDPVSGCNPNETCGHTFEKKECVGKLQKCPCCREDITLFSPALHTKNILDTILLNHPELWQDVYFNLDHFTEIFTSENGLKTQNGIRFLRLLSHASNHLNDKAIEGAQKGKSAIEILASTETGRTLMRKYFNIKIIEGKEKYYFGEAEISADSLQIQVEGKSIREWLDPTTELALQEQAARAKMTDDAISTLNRARNEYVRSKARLFSQPNADTGTGYSPCDAVNDILQQVVYGQRTKVREMLNKLKLDDPALLKTVLSSVATTPIIDYAGKTIENMTLLQAALAAGDVSLHPELIASDINHQGMCEIIKSYFDPDAQEEIASQYAHIFPNGVDACDQAQKNNTFNLHPFLDAISNASLEALDAALNLNGARFDEQDDTTRRKSFDQLSLVEKLNRFREAFTQRSLNETVSNPYHLLRAFELYNAFWDRCEQDGSDRDYKKRNLFWRQIIGFIQRFMSAADAQAISQGLWYLIKVDQDSSWRPEVLKNDFEFKHDRSHYFYPLRRGCAGLGFEYGSRVVSTVGGWWRVVFLQNLYRAKTSNLENLCSQRNHTSLAFAQVAR